MKPSQALRAVTAVLAVCARCAAAQSSSPEPAASYTDACAVGTFHDVTTSRGPWKEGCPGFKSCPPGYSCHRGVKTRCPSGTYSAGGTSACLPCDPGYVCSESSSSARQQQCGAPSRFCPRGSSSPSSVREGHYSTGGNDSATAAGEALCTPGTYCTDGVQSLCPAGSYGHTYGLSSSKCSGPCAGGFYCRPGSITPMQYPCPSPSVYCPEGSAAPRPVFKGFYSVRPSTNNGAAVLAGGASRQVICPVGHYCVKGEKRPCPAGTYGDRQGMYTASCSGSCTEGYYCPEGSYKSTQVECGSHEHYCPSGSGAPLVVEPGFFAQADGVNTTHPWWGVVHTLWNKVLCLEGHYCVGGRMFKCPAGTYGDSRGLTSARCSGPCSAGYFCEEGSTSPRAHGCGSPAVFCPQGSSTPQPVGQGYYSMGGGADRTTATAEAMCTPGTYCEGGVQKPCPVGRYGDAYGLHTANCSGVATEMGCGDPRFYCPAGSPSPIQVPEGHFSIASNLTIFTAVAIAPRGHYALLGVLRKCPGGTHGATEGLSTPLCSGRCDAGYLCEAGSTSSKQTACGGPAYYCPEGSAFRVKVSAGYWSSRWWGPEYNKSRVPPQRWSFYNNILGDHSYDTDADTFHYQQPKELLAEADQCPPGYFRNTTTADPSLHRPYDGMVEVPTEVIRPCQLCPIGTYKPNAGDDIRLCRPCDWSPSYSSPDRRRCHCYRLAGGATDYAVLYFNRSSGACVNVTWNMVPTDDVLEPSPLTSSMERPCPPGAYCMHGVMFPCPAGRYGSREMETSRLCEGPCAAGYWCPEGSSSATLRECGSPERYCPEGSPHPLSVGAGYYTSEDVHENLRSSRTLCPPGFYCNGDGLRRKCPAGLFGDNYGLVSAECNGACSSGYYCPAGSPSYTAVRCGGAHVYCPRGSAKPTSADPGFYTIRTGTEVKLPLPPAHVDDTLEDLTAQANDTQSAQVLCEPGYYCMNGIKYSCPEGTYGPDFGQKGVSECKPCPAGHLCPSYPGPPSDTAARRNCGNSANFCPEGTGALPLDVTPGWYTVGNENDPRNSTRVNQKVCERGFYCKRGIKFACPPGRFGEREGLKDPFCSGWCPAGTYCPEASTKPIPCAPGTYSFAAAAVCSACPTLPSPGSTPRCFDSRECCSH